MWKCVIFNFNIEIEIDSSVFWWDLEDENLNLKLFGNVGIKFWTKEKVTGQ